MLAMNVRRLPPVSGAPEYPVCSRARLHQRLEHTGVVGVSRASQMSAGLCSHTRWAPLEMFGAIQACGHYGHSGGCGIRTHDDGHPPYRPLRSALGAVLGRPAPERRGTRRRPHRLRPRTPSPLSGRGAAGHLCHRTATARRIPGTWAGSQGQAASGLRCRALRPCPEPGCGQAVRPTEEEPSPTGPCVPCVLLRAR